MRTVQERKLLSGQINEVANKLVPSLAELIGQGPDGEVIDPEADLDGVLDDARDILMGRLKGEA